MRARAIVLVAVCSCAASAQAGGISLTGMWTGEMRQIDPDHESRYPMTLVLKGETGATSYPTLKCAGALTKIAETANGYAIYQEKITNEPEGSCVDGIVTVTMDGGKALLGWFAAFEGAPTVATAVLSKQAQ